MKLFFSLKSIVAVAAATSWLAIAGSSVVVAASLPGLPRSTPVCVLVLPAVSASDPRPTAPSSSGEAESPASVPAEEPKLPAYVSSLGRYRVEFEIGGEMESEENYFFRVSEIALDSKGNLFVLDASNFCVKKFDPEGRHLTTFSRQGEGPGEMQQGFAMAVGPDDRVYLYDLRLRRFTIFDNEGRLSETIGLHEFGLRWIIDMHIGPEGNLYVATRIPDFRHRENPTLIKVSRFDLGTFEETPVDSAQIRETYMSFKGGTMTTVTAPYHAELFWGLTPSGGIVACNSDDAMLKLYSNELELTSERKIAHDPPKVTEEDEREYWASYTDPELIDRVEKFVEFPGHKPYFRALHIDAAGVVLLRGYEEGDDDETSPYDLFLPDGESLGRVTLPTLSRHAILGDGSIYNVEMDEEDSPMVRKYRPVE